MVSQEEQPKCSNGGNGGGKKKNEQKKIPQRGLGVAQLEKLRIEEQQKNHAPSSLSNASQGMIPFPSQQPILPFLTASNNPNPVLGPVVNHDPLFRHSESIPIPTNCFETTLPQLLENSAVASGNAGHVFLSMMWNSMEPSPINAEALARSFDIRTPLINGDSSIPGWPSSGLLQRRQRQQRSPISVVNEVSPPSSSGVSLQMEPPPNQSFTSNYDVSSSWPEEERVVGMKRPWPFHLEGMPGHTPFPCKFPSFSGCLKPNEWMPDFKKWEPKRTYFRNKENGCGIDGGSCSVGPSSTQLIPKPKQPTLTQPPSSLDYPEFSSVSYQPMGPNGCEKTFNEQRREALDGVDLSLKL